MKLQNEYYKGKLLTQTPVKLPSPIIPDLSKWPEEPAPVNKVMIGRHNSDIREVGKSKLPAQKLTNRQSLPNSLQYRQNSIPNKKEHSPSTSVQRALISPHLIQQSAPISNRPSTASRSSAHRASYRPAEVRTPRISLQTPSPIQNILLHSATDSTSSRNPNPSMLEANRKSSRKSPYNTPRTSVQLDNYLPNIPTSAFASPRSSVQKSPASMLQMPSHTSSKHSTTRKKVASSIASPFQTIAEQPQTPSLLMSSVDTKSPSLMQTSEYSTDIEMSSQGIPMQATESISQLSIRTVETPSGHVLEQTIKKTEIKQYKPVSSPQPSMDANRLHFSVSRTLDNISACALDM